MASSSSRKRKNEANVQGLLGIGQVVKKGPVAPKRTSRLARSLLNRYFWGDISALTVQHLANAANDDGLEDEVVRTLSSLGTEGAYTGVLEGCSLKFDA